MQKMLCASIAVLAAMLAPATAADLSVAPIYNSPAGQAETWGGSYTTNFGSGVWGPAATQDSTTGIAGSPAFNLGGNSVGVTSGLNLQDGKWVHGYETDVSVKQSGALTPNMGWNGETKERWLSTYRGRVGIAQDNWLFYATAGGALSNMQQNAVSPGTAGPDARWYWGWTAGAGVEWKVSSDLSAKVEYLYVGLQDKSYFSPAPSQFLTDQRIKPDDHTLRVGVNYKLPWNILDGFFTGKR
jgi:outer membrane immunogenic protein